MSNEQTTRYHLHWLTIWLESLQAFKEAILPFALIIATNFIRDYSELNWFSLVLFAGSTLILGLILLLVGFLRWRFCTYWFEGNELRIEQGVFVKKKRYVPFERIQSIDYTESIFHRLLHVVRVKIETAGTEEAEIQLSAISRADADKVVRYIEEQKKELVEKYVSPVVDEKEVFRITRKELFVLSITSSGAGLVVSGVLLFFFQFIDLVPVDWVVKGGQEILRSSYLLLVIGISGSFLVIWLLSVFLTYLSYHQFTVRLKEQKIMISRGLLEKKRATIPLNRVQSIRVLQNPLRQLIGYATIVLDSAGNEQVVLAPLIQYKQVDSLLRELFPSLELNEAENFAPKRSRLYYFTRDWFWILPLGAMSSYLLGLYGLLTFLLIPLVFCYRSWQYKSTGYMLYENQLTARFRILSLQRVYLLKKRIQAMTFKQNPFNKRNHVATLRITNKSGDHAFDTKLRHLDVEDAYLIYEWYHQHHKKTIHDQKA